MSQMMVEPVEPHDAPPADPSEVGQSQGRLILRRFLTNRISIIAAVLFVALVAFSSY